MMKTKRARLVWIMLLANALLGPPLNTGFAGPDKSKDKNQEKGRDKQERKDSDRDDEDKGKDKQHDDRDKKNDGNKGRDHEQHKVTICHKGHTITISRAALDAHLKHGDVLGPCDVTPHRNK